MVRVSMGCSWVKWVSQAKGSPCEAATWQRDLPGTPRGLLDRV